MLLLRGGVGGLSRIEPVNSKENLSSQTLLWSALPTAILRFDVDDQSSQLDAPSEEIRGASGRLAGQSVSPPLLDAGWISRCSLVDPSSSLVSVIFPGKKDW